MQQSLQEMMERLLAGQAEIKADISAPAKARQYKADAEKMSRQEQFKENVNGHREAFLD
jgi:hypothetical protein